MNDVIERDADGRPGEVERAIVALQTWGKLAPIQHPDSYGGICLSIAATLTRLAAENRELRAVLDHTVEHMREMGLSATELHHQDPEPPEGERYWQGQADARRSDEAELRRLMARGAAETLAGAAGIDTSICEFCEKRVEPDDDYVTGLDGMLAHTACADAR